jgi:hypothetical protein
VRRPVHGKSARSIMKVVSTDFHNQKNDANISICVWHQSCPHAFTFTIYE